MILSLVIGVFVLLASTLINLIPTFNTSNGGIGGLFYELLQIGFYFFGANTFVLVIGNVLLWTGFHFIWAVIQWVYKKIPGVD